MPDPYTWNEPDATLDDPHWILSYARFAPSSHNSQPWLVELVDEDHLDVYVDQTRLLNEVDPNARQAHVSLGCFLENLIVAARHRGRAPTTTYFPEGEYGRETVEDRPVARIHLTDEEADDQELFEPIAERRTNKRIFEQGRAIPSVELAKLHNSNVEENVRIELFEEAETREELTELCRRAMEVEVSSRERNRELARWFRLSDEELLDRCDGFSIAHSGSSGIAKWFTETFILNRERIENPNGMFARQAISMAEKQAGSASAFALVATNGNTRLDQLLAGRSYQVLQLKATRLGIATHPLSQPIEEYTDMGQVRSDFHEATGLSEGETAQMFLRLGYAESVPHTPRRPVDAIIRP